jgi:hypothetical protein
VTVALPRVSNMPKLAKKYGNHDWAVAFLIARGSEGEDAALVARAFYNGDERSMHRHLVRKGIAVIQGAKIRTVEGAVPCPSIVVGATNMFELFVWLQTREGVWYTRTQLEHAICGYFDAAKTMKAGRTHKQILYEYNLKKQAMEVCDASRPTKYMFK